MYIMHTFTQSGTYPEIGDVNFKCTPWTFKQQLALKMRARCRISNVFVQMPFHCGFRDTDISYRSLEMYSPAICVIASHSVKRKN